MNDAIFQAQATLTKALAHPTRLEIVHLLRHHVLTVGQISTMLGVSQSITSQHLSTMKRASVVASSRQGKEIYYTVADERILTACDAIRSLIANIPLPTSPEPDVIDPVCGMELTPKTASFNESYDGVRHYFCGKGCLAEFNLNPGHYVR